MPQEELRRNQTTESPAQNALYYDRKVMESIDEESMTSTSSSRAKIAKIPFVVHLRRQFAFWHASYFFDWLAAIAIFCIEGSIFNLVLKPTVRYIEQADPGVQFPVMKSIVPTWLLMVLVVVAPMIVFVFIQIWRRSLHDFHHACLGNFEGLVITNLVTDIIKVSIGRYRPLWAQACPSGDPSECAGDLRMSFPSGHSSSSFAAGIFVSLYLMGKLGLFRHGHSTSLWKAMICLSPLAVSFFVACSRLYDYHHNFSDVIAGSVIGLCFGTFAYHLHYPSPLFDDPRYHGVLLGHNDVDGEEEDHHFTEEKEITLIGIHIAFIGGGQPKHRKPTRFPRLSALREASKKRRGSPPYIMKRVHSIADSDPTMTPSVQTNEAADDGMV